MVYLRSRDSWQWLSFDTELTPWNGQLRIWAKPSAPKEFHGDIVHAAFPTILLAPSVILSSMQSLIKISENLRIVHCFVPTHSAIVISAYPRTRLELMLRDQYIFVSNATSGHRDIPLVKGNQYKLAFFPRWVILLQENAKRVSLRTGDLHKDERRWSPFKQ